MPWVTNVKFEIKNSRGKIISGDFDHLSRGEFPDLAGDMDGLLRILERQTHEIVYEIRELETRGRRVDFKQELKDKGWKMKDVAFRWSITPRQVSNIAKDPELKHWDMLDGLPIYDDEA